MAAVMCWVWFCALYVFASTFPGLAQSGFPRQHTLQTTVSHLPVFQCLRHAAAVSNGDPVTDSQMTLYFQSSYINTAPRAFLTTN